MKTGRTSFEERWRQRFTERARQFDDDAGIAGWSESGLRTRFGHFRRHWPGAPPGTLWLDVGCGAGTYSRFLAAEGLQVIGADYSLPTVSKARPRSDGVEAWMAADVTRLPLKPGSVDGILCFGVLQALSGSERAVAEMVEVLKPGGMLWLDALNGRCLPHRIRRLLRRPASLRYETIETLMRTLQQCGLTQITGHWVPIMPQPLQWAQPLLDARWLGAMNLAIPPLGAALSHSFLITGRKPTA